MQTSNAHFQKTLDDEIKRKSLIDSNQAEEKDALKKKLEEKQNEEHELRKEFLLFRRNYISSSCEKVKDTDFIEWEEREEKIVQDIQKERLSLLRVKLKVKRHERKLEEWESMDHLGFEQLKTEKAEKGKQLEKCEKEINRLQQSRTINEAEKANVCSLINDTTKSLAEKEKQLEDIGKITAQKSKSLVHLEKQFKSITRALESTSTACREIVEQSYNKSKIEVSLTMQKIEDLKKEFTAISEI